MELAWLAAIVIIALAFDFTNGFHDAANAIATSIGTRALTPRVALGMAAVMNLVGALISTGVAQTVGAGIIATPTGEEGLLVVFAALVGAIGWNLLTWYFGLPSSSSHALIGGLVGAAIAAATTVKWDGVLDKVVIPMVVSPLIGFVVAYLLHIAILWTLRRVAPGPANRGLRRAQTLSAAAMALGHGLQDAQKTMGVIVLALVTVDWQSDFTVPLWVILSVAVAMAAGTYAGGWRIIRTLSRRVVALEPSSGFAAEITAATVLYTTAALHLPVSTTHTITSAILGAGASRRLSAVRWKVARTILGAWILTLPGAALTAAATYLLLVALGRVI
ncbi:anion permease [Micromonospora sp. S4605]|uniref:inorganic phosphate transporter n=1 Tax=Micromonospora sp. S4605 TaxID=1420897 RepID=UPI000D6F2058|nr:inorganic phosphate transporter [Micromonospora sp. S4605]PWU50397.1 anion permease [Micromonospora sp. S4605]